MFFGRLKRVLRAVGTRLTGGYLLLLVLSIGLLYGLAAWNLNRALRQRDHDRVALELSELALGYASIGQKALEEEALEIAAHDGLSLFIRLSTASGETLFDGSNRAWPPGTLPRLRQIPSPADETWISLPIEDDEATLDMALLRLPDGNVLQVGTSTEQRGEVLEEFLETFMLAALPVLLLGLVGGLWLARRVLAPLRDLTQVVEEISTTGEVDGQRVPFRGSGDELDDLARLFNTMLDRVENLMDRLRETLDNVAHDLRTPLTHLRGRAELVLQEEAVPPNAYKEALADCLEDAQEVATILNTIMDVAEADTGLLVLPRETVSLDLMVRDVVELYDFVAEEKGVTLEAQAGQEITVSVDPGRIRQAIANLIDNAIKYTPPGGSVEVAAFVEKDEAILRVRDTGIGISEIDLPRIWNRLYRGDRSRSERGLGLGLSIVKVIVESYGGHVTAQSIPGEGSVFTMHLPLSTP